MYIPLKNKKNYKPIIQLKEGQVKSSNNDILLESAHAFDEQYIWAKKCAEIIYRCILDGEKKASISFKNTKDNTIKGAVIKISTNNILKTKAQIENITTEGFVKIEINTNKDILQKAEVDAINEIWNAIVHELGHGNIYWKRYINNQDINDTPDEYERWIEVITSNDISPDDILYLFCYALYSTHYQEIQAFVSQTYSDLITNLTRIYNTTKNISKEQFWKAIIETNTYQTYKKNIETCEKLLSIEGLRLILVKKLKKYNLFYNEDELIKKCNIIIEKSKDALKSSYNNAYQWFFKSFN